MSLKLVNKNGYTFYEKPEHTDREFKGKSIIDLPDDYTVIDVETTGLDSIYDSIIEISALRVRGKTVVDSFSSLVQPTKFYIYDDDDDDEFDEDEDGNAIIPIEDASGYYFVDEFITKLTGITNEMLENAPALSDVLPGFLSFVGDDYLVGHNVNFDINFIYCAALNDLGIYLKNDFIDTLRLSRKLFPDLAHHCLGDVAGVCGVPYVDAHRSLHDCKITHACFEAMRGTALSRYGSVEEFGKLFIISHGGRKVDCSQITAQTEDFDVDHPFYQKTVVFTGALSDLVRKDAMQLVVNVGGKIADSVTKATNYLVVGSFDYIKSVKGNKSSKIKKAEKMKLEGNDIEIISERTFREIMEI